MAQPAAIGLSVVPGTMDPFLACPYHSPEKILAQPLSKVHASDFFALGLGAVVGPEMIVKELRGRFARREITLHAFVASIHALANASAYRRVMDSAETAELCRPLSESLHATGFVAPAQDDRRHFPKEWLGQGNGELLDQLEQEITERVACETIKVLEGWGLDQLAALATADPHFWTELVDLADMYYRSAADDDAGEAQPGRDLRF